MVAALRNLQIAVVARGELQPAPVVPKTGNQIDERTLRRRRGVVNGVDDLLILMRAGDGEHVGEAGADDVGFAAHAAGDDDAAVFCHRFADRVEAFLLRRIDETSGVDEHHVGRSEEHTSELQSLMLILYAFFCLKKKNYTY